MKNLTDLLVQDIIRFGENAVYDSSINDHIARFENNKWELYIGERVEVSPHQSLGNKEIEDLFVFMDDLPVWQFTLEDTPITKVDLSKTSCCNLKHDYYFPDPEFSGVIATFAISDPPTFGSFVFLPNIKRVLK